MNKSNYLKKLQKNPNYKKFLKEEKLLIDATINAKMIANVAARYLENRVILQCPCGVESHFADRKELKKHLLHIIQWGL